jgi:NAD(P)-dependent dehydrogenase (short-subunit alcohol dehydrogenase family)
MRLKNKVAVVTGGSSGIGLATAQNLKAEGASVAICGRSQDALNVAQEQLGQDVLCLQSDIACLTDLERFFAAIEARFGKIDVLVANAGDVKFMPMDYFDEASFDYVTSNSFKGTFFTIQKALPHLNNSASIIVLSATGQSFGFPGSTVAAANKAAICSLARGVSADLLPTRGIRVNCISPGPIETPLFDKLGLPEEQVIGMKEIFKQQIPLKRMGTVEEVASTIVFLASDESSFVIGEEIKVGGGEGNLRV